MSRRLLLSVLSSTVALAAAKGTVTVKGHTFHAEVAATDEARANGLMRRASLAKDACMFFLYDEDGYHSIWMKNCLISLDVAWIDAEGRIVELVPDVPPPSPMRVYKRDADYPTYGGTVPSRHFIEFPVGTFKRLGLGKGDVIAWDLKLADGRRIQGPKPKGRK